LSPELTGSSVAVTWMGKGVSFQVGKVKMLKITISIFQNISWEMMKNSFTITWIIYHRMKGEHMHLLV